MWISIIIAYLVWILYMMSRGVVEICDSKSDSSNPFKNDLGCKSNLSLLDKFDITMKGVYKNIDKK